jgi:hypothetical protein
MHATETTQRKYVAIFKTTIIKTTAGDSLTLSTLTDQATTNWP